MKIVAFAASNSRQSINKMLVSYAAAQAKDMLNDIEVDLLDLNDFDMPVYSIDRENESGIPDQAHRFREKIAHADAILISFAEHNGSYTVAYKNIFDWASRLEGKVYEGKSVILMATSPGGRGAATVLEQAANSMPHFGATVLSHVSVPSFYDAFDAEKGQLTDEGLKGQLLKALEPLNSL